LMHIIMESAQRADEIDADHPQSTETYAESIPLETITSREFCLEIGIKLLIEFDNSDLTFHSILVGIEHEKYLLLKAPTPFESFARDKIEVGELIIKSLYKGTIYAFRSRLIAVISKPSRLMFIQYPEKIEHHELRAHKRFRCSIVAQALVDGTERGGIIENISMGGCRCTMETFPGENNISKTLLNEPLPFRCRFPGTPEEIRFTGKVRNAHPQPDEVSVGVEFLYTDNSRETPKIIQDYIQLIEYASENV